VELFAQLVLGCAGVKVVGELTCFSGKRSDTQHQVHASKHYSSVFLQGPLHVAHSPPLAPATSPQPENGTGAAAPSPSSHAVILEPAVTVSRLVGCCLSLPEEPTQATGMDVQLCRSSSAWTTVLYNRQGPTTFADDWYFAWHSFSFPTGCAHHHHCCGSRPGSWVWVHILAEVQAPDEGLGGQGV
jgi:hypothetical protein